MSARWDLSYEEQAALPPGSEKAVQYAVSGLLVDGAHHKQWCLERILEALGEDLDEIRAALQSIDQDWEDGIAP